MPLGIKKSLAKVGRVVSYLPRKAVLSVGAQVDAALDRFANTYETSLQLEASKVPVSGTIKLPEISALFGLVRIPKGSILGIDLTIDIPAQSAVVDIRENTYATPSVTITKQDAQ